MFARGTRGLRQVSCVTGQDRRATGFAAHLSLQTQLMAREPHDWELRHLRLVRHKPSAERGLGHGRAAPLFCSLCATRTTPALKSHRLAISSRLAASTRGVHTQSRKGQLLTSEHRLLTRVGMFTWVSRQEEGTGGGYGGITSDGEQLRSRLRCFIHQRVSNRQQAARQQTARSADSQQTASQPQPVNSQQQTHSNKDKRKAAPRTDPLSKTTKRKCPPTLVSDRPLTRQRVDQAGPHAVRQKRKRRDPECVTPHRQRTRQCIADRESCDSKQTMRCAPRKLTPCGADAGVPYYPG